VYWGFLQVGLQIPRKSAAGLYDFFHGAKKLASLARPGDLLLYGESASQIDHVMVCLRDWENGKGVLIGARGGDSSVKTFADAFFRNAKVDVVLSTYWRSRLQFCIDPWAASENQKRGGV
jgi:cell wall-associated NlpC family hydrolase